MGCRNSKPVAATNEESGGESTVTMVNLNDSNDHKPVPPNINTNVAAPVPPPQPARKSSITNLFSLNNSTAEQTSGGSATYPAPLTSQRESSRSIITPGQRVEMNRRASLEDFLLSKAVVKAIDAATTELNLAQPPDAVGVNFPQLLEFPVRAFKLSNLLSLSLKNNKLDKLPTEFGIKFSLLQSLDISENQLTVLPDCICDCTKLETLDISENMIVALPSIMNKLTNLKTLIAFKNNLTSLPEELSNCTQLETVNVFNNKILRISPTFGTAWINIKEFNAGSNKLKSFPPIPGWTKLTRLALQWNGIVEISDLSITQDTLTQFQINDNALSTFPNFGEAKVLTLIDISSNMITEIPDTIIKSCQALETLTIRKNKISKLSNELLSLPKLALLDIQENELSEIPSTISNLKNSLITLLINKNNISLVPAALKDCTLLQRVSLEGNPLNYSDESLKPILWDVKDICIANGGWLRTSGTAIGSRPKPTPVDDTTTTTSTENAENPTNNEETVTA